MHKQIGHMAIKTYIYIIYAIIYNYIHDYLYIVLKMLFLRKQEMYINLIICKLQKKSENLLKEQERKNISTNEIKEKKIYAFQATSNTIIKINIVMLTKLYKHDNATYKYKINIQFK